MSKYTTEVRFICEQKAGLTESKGANNIDTVIAAAWNQIFTKEVEFFDSTYKETICSKILRHYYFREIGAETSGLWCAWMNTTLSEIMPYYNKLYASALLELDPFNDTDYTRTGTRAGTQDEKTQSTYADSGTNETQTETTDTGNSTVNGSHSDTGNTTVNDTRTDTESGTVNDTRTDTGSKTSYDLFSDTPQGALTGVENQTYLTEARKITDSVSNTSTGATTTSKTNTGNGTSSTIDTKSGALTTTTTDSKTGEATTTRADTKTGERTDQKNSDSAENYYERIAGKMASTSYSELLQKFRDTFINIDMMVINEFEDCFLKLW